MSFCRDGITIDREFLDFPRGLAALLTVLLQLMPAVAEDPSAKRAGDVRSAPAELHFTTPEAPTSREGFLSLEWDEHPEAFEYRLVNGEGIELYRGPFPKGFISGLPDGAYEFSAAALDESGQVLARTSTPYPLTVEHWPMQQAWLLFSIGLIVFLALVLVLLRGSIGAGAAGLDAKPLASERAAEANE